LDGETETGEGGFECAGVETNEELEQLELDAAEDTEVVQLEVEDLESRLNRSRRKMRYDELARF
jgi:hypothetical protein